jgi:signal transduction histidine kinase
MQMREVLLHLAVNATEAMPDGGTLQFQTGRAEAAGVAVSTAGAHGFAWIEVRDTGRGIAPDLLPRVFEPFVTTKTTEGSGLGLAILYNVLREHGGGVTIESTPGTGTAVRMFLPRSPDRVPQQFTGPPTGVFLHRSAFQGNL